MCKCWYSSSLEKLNWFWWIVLVRLLIVGRKKRNKKIYIYFFKGNSYIKQKKYIFFFCIFLVRLFLDKQYLMNSWSTDFLLDSDWITLCVYIVSTLSNKKFQIWWNILSTFYLTSPKTIKIIEVTCQTIPLQRNFSPNRPSGLIRPFL